MPFLELASIHTAGSHFSNPIGLSSKIVPSFTENCRPQSRHFQIRRGFRKKGVFAFHAAPETPVWQRSAAREGSALFPFAGQEVGSWRGVGEVRGVGEYEEH